MSKGRISELEAALAAEKKRADQAVVTMQKAVDACIDRYEDAICPNLEAYTERHTSEQISAWMTKVFEVYGNDLFPDMDSVPKEDREDVARLGMYLAKHVLGTSIPRKILAMEWKKSNG